MLKFPLASTGERFGVVRRFQPFIDRALERRRLHAVTQPRFQGSIHYDDTDGYFVIGGGKYLPGIHGYFGPIKYYRFGTKEVENQLHPKSLQEVDKTHQECQEIKAFTKDFFHKVAESYLLSPVNRGSLEMTDLRSILFEQAVGEMFTVDQPRSKITSKSTALLQVASCFGNHKASLLLATLHFSGLEHSVDLQQGHVYSLIAAAGDNRFALMHAGYKHTQGIDGFPKDLDMAYSYYSNIGAQSNIDSSRIHEDKGHGVKRNYTRGFRLLEKAAAMGSINALNGLGWYHAIILKDHKKAVKYFEQAALNGSDDAMYNLGIYHLSGENPDSPRVNETAAFQQFLNASQSCHMAASVEAAWYLSTGCLEGVSQDVERAVMKEAFVSYLLAAESGLGSAQSNVAHLCECLITGGLKAADEHITHNSSHILKEENQAGGKLSALDNITFITAPLFLTLLSFSQMQELHLSHDCQWRYHNYSILNYDPHPSALLKMGDYYYRSSSTREDSLSVVGRAISMYGRAALAGSPQGMYNLAVLAHEGHVLPLSVSALFNVSHRDERDIVVEKILERCVESEDEEAVTPCSLTLLGLQMGKALRRMTQNAIKWGQFPPADQPSHISSKEPLRYNRDVIPSEPLLNKPSLDTISLDVFKPPFLSKLPGKVVAEQLIADKNRTRVIETFHTMFIDSVYYSAWYIIQLRGIINTPQPEK
ncbi:hypothetical protein L3Q82_008046 [Scortum barcoo]|uniref:Uncharacterized protein n=1 Tax=Scortum barcoo TaxID=214431 RepID=A0ACB8WKS9_9TELE|nr:hypothetical protein L3Q82_008046 [Scortum barcoo]